MYVCTGGLTFLRRYYKQNVDMSSRAKMIPTKRSSFSLNRMPFFLILRGLSASSEATSDQWDVNAEKMLQWPGSARCASRLSMGPCPVYTA